jgi:hypothetical protein
MRQKDKTSCFLIKSHSVWGGLFYAQGETSMDKLKIRFISSSYKTLYYVDDGDDIEVEVDGEWLRLKCRYIDETHAEIGGRIYHICEFAQSREQLVQRYRAAKAQTMNDADNGNE